MPLDRTWFGAVAVKYAPAEHHCLRSFYAAVVRGALVALTQRMQRVLPVFKLDALLLLVRPVKSHRVMARLRTNVLYKRPHPRQSAGSGVGN
jgi:hypothetical protein